MVERGQQVLDDDLAGSGHRAARAEIDRLVTPERGLTGVRISTSGAVTLLGGAGVEAQAAGACTEEVLLTTPREFLLRLLAKGG